MTNPALLLLFPLSAALAFAPNPALRTRVQPLVTTRAVSSRLLSPKHDLFHTTNTLSLRPRTTSALYVSMMNDEDTQVEESWEDDSKLVEAVLLVAWALSISAFILVNNFVGPWPDHMAQVPERVWFVLHMLGGMLFGGGVILTTAIEWLVAHNRNSPVLQFWFDKVPLLDAAIVLPALTIAMISGTGLAIEHYGGLGVAPPHIATVFYTLVAFATWWGLTDLTTQGKALTDVNEWAIRTSEEAKLDIPPVVEHRKISNVVSCLFIVALYCEMTFKPFTLFWKDGFMM